MTTFLQQIVNTCCKIHFKEIDPKKVRFVLTPKTRKFDGKRRMVGLMGVKNGIITIQIDKAFSEDADPSSITVKIAHELAHVKLKHPMEITLENEEAAEGEVKKFFDKWLKRG